MSGSIVANGNDELKARVRELKKKPMNCALGDVGKLAEIRLHPTKQPTMLLAELRKDEPKVGKPACGLAFVPEEKPNEVRLDLRTKPASGICKRVAKRLKGTGLRKVVLLVMGEPVESHSIEEDEEQAAAERTALRARVDRAGEIIGRLPADDGRGNEVRSLFGSARESLQGEDRDATSEIVARLEQLLAMPLWTPPVRPAAARQGAAAERPQLASTRQQFTQALRGAQVDLLAARQSKDDPADATSLQTLIQAMTAASAEDAGRAAELCGKARKVAVEILGKSRKLASQTAVHERMAPVFAKVEKTYFTIASIQSLSHAEEPPTEAFKAFIIAQANFRKNPDIDACDAIAQAADAYLAHLNAQPDEPSVGAKNGKELEAAQERTAKKAKLKSSAETAKTAARHMKMALEAKQLGAPPWDEPTALKAATLAAAFNFETTVGLGEGETVGKQAQPLGSEGGISASFWITGHEVGSGPATEPAKQFLFKPAKGEQTVPGFIRGGSAPREAISKALADTVLATTGLDLRVPETTVVSIAPAAVNIGAYNKLQPEETKRLQTDQPLVGSMQQFAASKGSLLDTLREDRDFLDRLPEEDCHRFAILDILTLNCDRHPGNFMVAKGDEPGLIPIDHGLTFPSNDGLEKIFSQKMNNPLENVLLCAAGNMQPFSEETTQRLEMLDPDAIAAATRANVDSLDQVHPGLGVRDLVPDESLGNARRAAMFLKLACRRLTPVMIQIVLGTERASIFGGSDEDFEQAAAGLIDTYAGRMPAIHELIRRKFDSAMFQKALKQNGWHDFIGKTSHLTAYRAWIYADPQRALDAYVNNTKAPAGYNKPVIPVD